MNELEFLKHVVSLAKQTRLAQDRYFSTRDPSDLREAKRLERELDKELVKVETGKGTASTTPTVQGSLFDTHPDAARM